MFFLFICFGNMTDDLLVINTTYNVINPLYDAVKKLRKIFKKSFTNVRVVLAVFDKVVRKLLWIFFVIDDYNYYMNGVDVVN